MQDQKDLSYHHKAMTVARHYTLHQLAERAGLLPTFLDLVKVPAFQDEAPGMLGT
jgi:hypothetical protein